MDFLHLSLLTLHNLTRWLILLTGIWTLVRVLPNLSGGRSFTPADRRPVALFMSSLHLQLILGLLMFAFLGMQSIPVFADTSRTAFQWEHLTLGAVAVVFGTLAGVLSRRAGTEQAKFRTAALWTALALATALLNIPWWRPLLRLFNA